MNNIHNPRYEFRIFGNHFQDVEERIRTMSGEEQTRSMMSVYILASGNPKNNIKIREGIMDIKVLEGEYQGLEQWNPFLVGKFPLKSEIVKSVIFPALGVQCPAFEREKYTLKQFIDELVCIDPDLSVAYVNKKRYGFILDGVIAEIAEIKVNGASAKTICIEAEDPEKVLKLKTKLGINDHEENVNYSLALKRFMGLVELPETWKTKDF